MDARRKRVGGKRSPSRYFPLAPPNIGGNRLKKRPSFCENGMRCTDPGCKKSHPLCKKGGNCENKTCGFVHPGGWRYTPGSKKPAPTKTDNLCWKREKCGDANCSKQHPLCKDKDECKNQKCGFFHPSGRRYTGPPPKVLELPSLQSGGTGIGVGCIDSSGLFKPFSAFPTRANNTAPCMSKPQVIQVTQAVSPAIDQIEVVLLKTRAKVERIENDRTIAWLKPDPSCFAKHPEFYEASQSSVGTRLDLNQAQDVHQKLVLGTLAQGDKVTVYVRLDREKKNLVAENAQLLHFNPREKSDDDLIALLAVAVGPVSFQKQLLKQILDQANASHRVVAEVLRRTYPIWADCSQLVRARRLAGIFVQSSFLLPLGSLCANICLLSEEESWAAVRMLGTICTLHPSDIRLFVHVCTCLTSHLGTSAIEFLNQVLQIAAPLQASDPLSYFSWWQLPSVPLGKELLSWESYGVTDLDSLPSVKVGAPYPSVEAYISTYMRLYRADCFHEFVLKLREQFLGCDQKSGDTLDLVMARRIFVCGIHISDNSGEMDVQLGCTIEDITKMRHNSFGLNNLLCISLEGMFKEGDLAWATISAPPEMKAKVRQSTNRSCRVLLSVRFCSKANHMQDEQLIERLRAHQQTARLVENPVSFISYEPVMEALRSLWRPGHPIMLPFAATLLKGEVVGNSKNETQECIEAASRLGITGALDDFQLEAFENVAKNEFALIQGPPGCGKSYLGSRVCRVLAEIIGRVLIVTFKNHALDEMLVDVAQMYGGAGLSQVIRVGNNKKISRDLKPRSLHAVLSEETGLSEENTSSSEKLRKLTSRCNSISDKLRRDVRLTSDIFSRATGSDGKQAVLRILRSYGNASFVEYTAETVDPFLEDWAKQAVKSLISESKAYWDSADSSKTTSLQLEQELFAAEQNKGKESASDFEGFSETHPESLMGLMISRGAFRTDVKLFSNFDLCSMASWTCDEKKRFILFALSLEFSNLTDSFSELVQGLGPLQDDARASRLADETSALRSVPIIGSTVLGALLNMDAISAAEPTVLLLEEAGEVPEAMLIALLRIPSLRRCVMIGDYQQLRPTVNSHRLQKNKKLNISCFERLVELHMPRSVLKTQNRMREDVLLPVLQHYPGIVSNLSIVSCLSPIPWLAFSLFWWVCESKGIKQDESWYNEEQAQRAVHLSKFLVDQDAVPKENITILVPYASQLFHIRSLLRGLGVVEISVSTIDQYQGDENSVIILCLVRCDHDRPDKLGFLSEVNRMIVATSRQKQALIIVGSEECFGTNSHWKALQDNLKLPWGDAVEKRIGPELPLRCPRHPQKFLKVPDSRCFPPSGCGEGCSASLDKCAHKCSLKCHPQNVEHGKCKVTVDWTHDECKHCRQYQCHAIPDLCPVPVLKPLPCGHKKEVSCGILQRKGGSKKLVCEKTVDVRLSCGHQIWLKCGVDVEGYESEDFTACPSCILRVLRVKEDLASVDSLIKCCQPPVLNGSITPNAVLTAQQSKLIVDATIRAGLCGKDFDDALHRAVRQSKMPSALLSGALPKPSHWDPHATNEQRCEDQRAFAEEQFLLRVLIQETGLAVSPIWQKQALTLLAGLSLSCVQNRSTSHSNASATDAEAFFARLRILRQNKVSSPQTLIGIIRKAGSALYKALSEHPKSGKLWYNIEEGALAERITSRLVAETSENAQAHKNSTSSNWDPQKALAMITDTEWNSLAKTRETRNLWGLKETGPGEIQSPPYQEVPHEYLYRASLAGSQYVSIDLKSADFHVLRLAAPELIEEGSWQMWVHKTIPDLVKRVPFLPEMKPLRVRVLGKTLHKKNAALQCHCLRLLLRLLLFMAETVGNAFDLVERVFQFSCDELCLKLKQHATSSTAMDLANKIKQCLEEMHWQTLLPVRIETFELCRMPMMDDQQHNSQSDQDSTTTLYLGHPALRESLQFVDLPAVHDPAWSKPKPPKESYDDSYFIRKVHIMDDHNRQGCELQFKNLSKQLRPLVILEHLSKAPPEMAPETKLSLTAPAFVPRKAEVEKKKSSRTQTMSKSSQLSASTGAFTPKKSTSSPTTLQQVEKPKITSTQLSSIAPVFNPNNLSSKSETKRLSSSAPSFVPKT